MHHSDDPFSDSALAPCDGLYKGACYNVFSNGMSVHYEAEGKCRKQGPDGHLVAFHSQEDVDFIAKLIV